MCPSTEGAKKKATPKPHIPPTSVHQTNTRKKEENNIYTAESHFSSRFGIEQSYANIYLTTLNATQAKGDQKHNFLRVGEQGEDERGKTGGGEEREAVGKGQGVIGK